MIPSAPLAPSPSHASTPTGLIPREAFASLVREVRAEVDARLSRILDDTRAQAATYGGDVAAMADGVRDLTLRGGKRLRAALAVAAYRACGGAPDGEAGALDVGAALELLQTYLLIHDDWMDNDDVRRGGPSVHAMLRVHFGSKDRGDWAGILAGDLASALCTEVVAKAAAPAPRVLAATVLFSQITRDAIFGQLLDIGARAEDVETMHTLKTGSYTVRGPLLLGAVIAAATEPQRAALARFADPLGVAFQLRDDLLGTYGDPSETGKPFGNDLRAGKRTALIVEAENRLDASGQAAVAAALGVTDASDAVVRGATDALTSCGARDAVDARVTALAESAVAGLATAPFDDAGKRLLEGAAMTLTARRA